MNDQSEFFASVTLRCDAWEAVRKQIDGRALTTLQKDQVRIAYEAILSACMAAMTQATKG